MMYLIIMLRWITYCGMGASIFTLLYGVIFIKTAHFNPKQWQVTGFIGLAAMFLGLIAISLLHANL